MLMFLGIMTVIVPQIIALECHQRFDYKDGVIPFLNITVNRNEDCDGMCAYFKISVEYNEEGKDKNDDYYVFGCYPKANQTGLFAAAGTAEIKDKGLEIVVGFTCNKDNCNSEDDPRWKRSLKLRDDVKTVANEVKARSNISKPFVCHDANAKSKSCNGFCSLNYKVGPQKIEPSAKCTSEYKYDTHINYVVLAKTKEVPEVQLLCKFSNCNAVKNTYYSKQLTRLTGHFQELIAEEPEDEVIPTQSANGLIPLLFVSSIFAVFNF